MEGGRIRSSVALPREVAKPTVIEDNGEKITLKAGQQIFVNLVCLLPPQNVSLLHV
jgi:linoleate 8R-lipoxygenase/9,12-octadecadienoate 8-hydroperoxide 8R-isomerase